MADFVDAPLAPTDAAAFTDAPLPTKPKLKGAGALVGGAVGGMVGGVPGAALGGAGGSGIETLLRHLGEIPGAVVDVSRNLVSHPGATLGGFGEGAVQGATDAGISGAVQGALEGAGGLVAKGLKAAAPRIMQGVLKPTQTLRNEFPTIAKDAVASGISLSEKGLAKAGKLIGQRTQQVTDAIANATGAAPIAMQDVLSAVQPVAQKVAQEPLRAGKLSQLSELGGQALKENPNPIPLLDAQAMKQAAQRIASEGYAKVAKGADINTVPLDFNMALARGLREQIESRVPEVAGLNAQTQNLIGVERAVEQALGRIGNTDPSKLWRIGGGAAVGGAVGQGVGADPSKSGGIGAALGALSGNPALLSRVAIGADRLAPLASHAPHAARAALLAALGLGDE